MIEWEGPRWFKSLDPEVAEAMADYLESEEALDVITDLLEMEAACMVTFNNPFNGRTRKFVEEHPKECAGVIKRAAVMSYFAITNQLRFTKVMAKAEAEKKQKEEEQ